MSESTDSDGTNNPNKLTLRKTACKRYDAGWLAAGYDWCQIHGASKMYCGICVYIL